ncbi:MAG: protein kinase [Planctomycetota bacterium]
MKIDKPKFLELLAAARIVDPANLQAKVAEFEFQAEQGNLEPSSDSTDGSTSPADDSGLLAQFLVHAKLITKWQSEVLLAGHYAPINAGDYLLTGQQGSGPLKGSFDAVHRKTGVPVLLTFLQGDSDESLAVWKQIELLSGAVNDIDHPNLVPIFETVVLPQYRFAVTGPSTGRSLAKLMPEKSRMPWHDACRVILSVARGLNSLHEKGIVHNAVSPMTVWFQNKELSRLRLSVTPEGGFEEHSEESRYDYMAPEVVSDQPALSARSDFYAIGCLLFRMISGRPVFENKDVHKVIESHKSVAAPSLAKYKIPPELDQFIARLLDKDPEKRQGDCGEIISTLTGLIPGKDTEPEKAEKFAAPASQMKLRAWLARQDAGAVDFTGETRVSEPTEIVIDAGEESAASVSAVKTGIAPIAGAEPTTAGKSGKPAPRKKNKWMMPLVVAGSLLAFAGLIGGLMWYASQQEFEPEGGDDTTADAGNETGEETPDGGGTMTSPTIVRLDQELIDDDRESLWQSPTEAANIDFSYLPGGPRLVYIMRPASLMADAQGELLMRGLGPRMNTTIATWQTQTGVRLNEIDQLILAYYSTGSSYETCYVVRLTEAEQTGALVSGWQGITISQTGGGQAIYSSGNNSYFPIPGGSGDTASGFVYGPTEQIQVVADNGVANSFSGSFRALAEWTDRDRHLTFMFLRQALVNQEGQQMMGPSLRAFNRKLDYLMPDELRGGIVSMHIDRGSYFEVVLDQSVDMRSSELQERMEGSLRTQRDELSSFVASIPAAGYWRKVQERFPLIVADFYRNLRWDVENGKVIANCWLPEMAAHNILASSELVISFAGGASGDLDPAANTGSDVPGSLEELLAAPRSLNLVTNPDLIVLLADLEQEISDDYPGLSFPFAIRLIGNDLEADGITQNQRPGAFKLDNKTLAEILTEIMVRCNPNKDISGPSDPECKLVWVVGDDPESPGSRAIVITTRAGAAAKGIELPEAFRLTE